MRIERDFLGEMEVPAGALYGIHTMRAVSNFPDHNRFHSEWYKATGLVKQACYLTIADFSKAIGEKLKGDPEKAVRILKILHIEDNSLFEQLFQAASEVSSGKYFDSFLVPAVSGGAGTSINMNINEIITNVALGKLGKAPGSYDVIGPLEHANLFQSTNDVIPTSLKVAAMYLLQELEQTINDLRFETERLEKAGQHCLRIGYTQMQEAVPSSFGKLFSTYSEALSRDWWRVSKCFERIKQVNLGGSAIGTGLAAPRFFIMEVVSNLQKVTGLPVARSENLPDTTSNHDSLVEVHATLKAHAVNLEKMVSDLRLLASEIGNPVLLLPRVQVGSSIMPGKINPVIPEFVISSAHKIYANDQLISSLAAQGCLELNAYLPVIGHALLESVKLLIAAGKTLKINLFNGLKINQEVSVARMMNSPSVTTALNPVIGYHKASEIAGYMKTHQVDVFQANQALGILPGDKILKLMEPENLLKLGFVLGDLGDPDEL